MSSTFTDSRLSSRRRSAVTATARTALTAARSEQALEILHAGYSVLPMVAGGDKFTNFLTDWDKYLAPSVKEALPMSSRQFMMAVGVVEIAAGLLVAARPRLGGYVVSLWLAGIVGNLLLTPGYKDIALRDFGLSLGALALARLSKQP